MIRHKTVNPKTDRVKKRYTSPTYNMDDIYRWFKKKHPNYKNINFKTFRDICFTFNLLLSEEILDGVEVNLPYRTGKLSITNSPADLTKCLQQFNNKILEKTGKTILEIPSYNDGYFTRWRWTNKRVIDRSAGWYTFTACRHNTDALKKFLKDEISYRRYNNLGK